MTETFARLLVIEEAWNSIQSNDKTIELRMLTDRNRQNLQPVLDKKPGEKFRIFQNRNQMTVVVKKIEKKKLKDITPHEFAKIVGRMRIATKEQLIDLLSLLYVQKFTGDSEGHLIHFKR
jgi:hypothetical protein